MSDNPEPHARPSCAASAISARPSPAPSRLLAHAADLAGAGAADDRLRVARAVADRQGLRRRSMPIVARPVPAILMLLFIWPASTTCSSACRPSSRTTSTASMQGLVPDRQPVLLRRGRPRLRLCGAAAGLRTTDAGRAAERQPISEKVSWPANGKARRPAGGCGLSDHRPHLRRGGRRGRRRGTARDRRLRPGRAAHRLHHQGVPDPLAYGRGAGRHLGLARQYGAGRLALAHVRHRQGVGLAGRPGRHRIPMPQRARRPSTSSSTGACPSRAPRKARSTSGRSAA